MDQTVVRKKKSFHIHRFASRTEMFSRRLKQLPAHGRKYLPGTVKYHYAIYKKNVRS
jgi:hypothetical protein